LKIGRCKADEEEISMVEVSVNGDKLSLEVKGLDKLWALKSHLEIPLAHIKGVQANPPGVRDWFKGLKSPGTNIPGVITAGTFYQDGKRVFWDVHNPDKAIAIELNDERYNMLIVEVANPDATIGMITSAIGR
jgi:hypothetical protein